MLLDLTWPTLIAVAVMALLTYIAPRFSTAVVLSVASIPFAFFQIVGLGLGHCWPSETVVCPTVDEVRLAMLCIACVALLSNALMWLFVVTRRSRADKA